MNSWLPSCRRRPLAFVVILAVLLGIPIAGPMAAGLESVPAVHPLHDIFPGADRLGVSEGVPPAAPVFINNKMAGYLFSTQDVVNSVGYSGKPVNIIAGITLDGILTGAVVAQHQEPILVLGIPYKRIDEFTTQYRGVDIRGTVRLGKARSPSDTVIDMVSGASITSLVFNDSIIRSARMVARSRGIISHGRAKGSGREIDVDTFRKADWNELIKDGSIRRLHLTNASVDKAFSGPLGNTQRKPDDAFIDIYAALATPAAIGQNLMGFPAYNTMISETPPGAQSIWVAGGGFYSFRGYTYRKTGVFDRLQMVQGKNTIPLTGKMHHRVPKLAMATAPQLREISLFYIPKETGFDAAKPWRLEILAEREGADGKAKFVGFSLNYELPAAYFIGGEQTPESSVIESYLGERPLWLTRWEDGIVHIVLLSMILAGLLGILFFQDWVTQRKNLSQAIRLGFLTVTLVYIGWIASAQLSVINVMTFISALLTGFRWDFFLLEPLIFILWSFVAIALLFWGRGVFCGWLCPFGALQELINRISRYFQVPQFKIPFTLNERIWPIKYIVFLGLMALSLGPNLLAEQMAEVEPFKTAIALKFFRTWPFVVYAIMVLAAGMFVQRVFCRYLCPLGAALAIPSNNRMFDWLKRRRQCGTECHICSIKCPVQAIHPDGHINAHECIYCLDCQSIYYDDHKCPPLIDRRNRREKRRQMRQQRAEERKAQTLQNPALPDEEPTT